MENIFRKKNQRQRGGRDQEATRLEGLCRWMALEGGRGI
jgi:hypothetical protein